MIPHLPDVLVVDPHRPLLAPAPGTRVIGLAPGTAVVVEDLTPPLAAMLDAFARPADPDRVLVGAVAAGADPREARALLADLLARGAVVDAGAPARIARRRATSSVRVVGDGPLAIGVACGLAAAGVGTVEVRADGVVLADDVGTGWLEADRGHPRAAAAADALRRVAARVAVRLPHRARPDLVVLADAAGADPLTVRDLVARGTTHLQVRTRDGRGVVGPLVLPGRSACLECLDRHRAAREPGWAGVAAGIARVRGTADAAAVVATIGVATAQVLAVVDGARVPPATLDATVEIDAATARTTRRRWSRHQECPCSTGTAAVPGIPVPRARRDAECTRGPRRETIDV
ncbi:hypothetical protein Psed_1119 [Pseudonocardia dioxanivorans CB1190]|uniref:THIF-type NAD/FAD binding fold domain-containing protein n=2 Tax=Pseudonocardia TaxID=1847 RepID=F4CSG5_PSEUX|nr:hypothetical protein [Pseudonocardia dioxanivorans]AEA23370.1 hypothetical protein Psed_1119 [Pseudonocardia dioxanivorans CB1190]